MTDDHRIYADWAAAYTLGALDPDDRKDFELHLADCEICAAELAAFAPLPGLIAKVEPADLGRQADSPRASAIEAGARNETLRLRRQANRWRTVALLVAGLLMLVIVLPRDSQDPAPETQPAIILESEAESASIATSTRLWGTEVTVELSGLPARDSYQLWTVDAQGDWTSAATWLATPSGSARLTGASSTPTAEIRRIVVTSQDQSEILVDASI